MKKNRMMRLASILLICVLLTTSVISGTFAKYTTTKSSSDTARIAKWGIGAPTSLNFNLFADNAFEAGKVEANADAEGNKDNVLAPGTSHEQEITLLPITGAAPEVKYRYTVALTVEDTTSTIDTLDDLAGFKWTLTALGKAKQEFDTFEALQTAVNGLSQTEIAPNVLPAGYATGANRMVIGWAWAYDTTPTAGGNDVGDTAAGNAAAAGTLDTFTLTLTITAEQVD